MASDVCFLLEGTFPYVSGGVSSWVYQLIRDLPGLKFSLVYLGASESVDQEYKYPIPENVVEIREVYLQGGVPIPPRPPPRTLGPQDWARLRTFLAGIREGDVEPFAPLVLETFRPGRDLIQELLYAEGSWEFLKEQYARLAEEPSFLDYFWTWRFSHLPILRTLSAGLPEARCYHAVSTGYAGLLAAAARVRTGAPLILTEHGIYTRERRIEIARASWIHDEEELSVSARESFFKDWWIRMFAGMSRIVYRHADVIVTLYEGNRQAQISDGADPAKIRIIPNGVDILPFTGLRPVDAPADPPTVALVGRVVPIKDVKTFIRAAKILHAESPGIRFQVLGPLDEDPDYFRDCEILARMLGLEGVVQFLGKVDLARHFAGVDCLVLTSVSEGQPLVVLEAFAAGIPVVATDVGACRNLVEGAGPEDRALGEAGIITSIGKPDQTAAAVRRILSEPGTYLSMARAGRERAAASYRLETVSAQYQALYEQLPLLAELKSRGADGGGV